MEVLNSKEFASTLQRCCTYPKYSVGVMFDNVARRNEFITEMRITQNTDWNVPKYGSTIRFSNGSYIKPIATDGSPFRVQRFNEILFDGELFTEEYINTVFKPMLKSYTIPEGMSSDDIEEDDNSLNDFLGTFKIHE